MASTAHCTPSCAALFIEISAMIASTTTCARRTSNWRITACSGRNTSIGAVITRALVLSSACMVKPCPCCARLGLAAAGVALALEQENKKQDDGAGARAGGRAAARRGAGGAGGGGGGRRGRGARGA